MRCDVIASGVINAAKNIGMKKPIVIRLQGTNVEQANKLIAERFVSGLRYFFVFFIFFSSLSVMIC